jgi:hypothetical protein
MKRTTGTAIDTFHHEVTTMMRNGKNTLFPALILALSAAAAGGCNDSPFTVAVDRPLMVVYMSPGPSQQHVPLEAQVTIVFSEEVKETGFEDAENFAVEQSAGASWKAVAGSAAWDAASKTLVFKPAAKLVYSATYRIHLGAGLTKVDTTDTSGGHLPGDIDAVFTTVDPPELKVLSVYPSNGAAGVAPDARIVVTFSRKIDQEKPSFDPTASFVVTDTADPAAPSYLSGTWVFDDSTGYTVATFTPADPKDPAKAGLFGYSRVIRLTLSRDVRSLDAKGIKDSPAEKDRKVGHLPAPVTVNFSTEALPVLSVVSILPAPGAHAVPTDAAVTVTFSEPVDQPSVVTADPAATFVVKDLLADAVIPGTAAFNADGTVATFTAASPFGYSRQVGVELKSGIRSVRALALVNPPPDRRAIDGYLVPAVAASFSTIDPPDLLLVDATPDPGSDNVARETPVRLVFSEPIDIVPFTLYPADLAAIDHAIRVVDISDPINPILVQPKDPAAPVSFSSGDSVVTFTPTIPWGWSRTYQVDLSMAVRSKRATQVSGSLPQAIAFTFKTLDPPPFTLVAAAPSAGADAIGIDAQLWWTFSSALDPRTLVRRVAEGSVASAGTDSITVAGAAWAENTLAGDYLTLSKAGEPDVYALVISNTADTIAAEAPFGAAVDATWTFAVGEPSIRLTLRGAPVAPASLAAPFGLEGNILDSGTATGAGTGTLVDAAKAWTEGGLSSSTLMLTGGPGEGQVRSVLHNDGTTLYLDAPWDVAPDATSTYEVRQLTTVRFVPAKRLAYDAEYLVDLAGGTDEEGNPKGVTSTIATREGGYLAEPISYSFTTVKPPPLLVAWTSPSDKADSIDPDVSVVITFSEDVDPATLGGNITFTDAAGAAVPFTLAPQGVPTNQVTLNPARADPAWPRLAYSTGHTVTLSDAIASVRGGRLPEEFEFVWKTLDPPPLALVSATPATGPQAENEGVKRETAPDSGVPASFVLVFSEGVKCSTVDTNGDGKLDATDLGNVKVEDVTALSAADARDPSKPGVAIAGALAWNDTDAPKAGSRGEGADTTFTFTPDAIPGYSTLIRITVRGQDDAACADTSACTLTDAVISDRATGEGGQLPDTIVVLFRIEDPPPLSLISVVNRSGLATQPRDAGGGAPDAVVVTLSEGVRQTLATLRSATNPAGMIVLEDVTGKANPLTDAANGYVGATLAFLDVSGAAAPDAAPGTSGTGKDAVVRITPDALLGYGTVLRLTLVAKDAPDLTAIQSDRATVRGGQLPACKPSTGNTCVSGNYVFILRVEELPPLSVLSFIPGNLTATAGAGAQGVAFDQSTITAVFSEALDCASVTALNAPVVWDSTDPVSPGTAVGGAWGCAGDTATFTATAAFGYSRDVLTTLSTTVRSARAVYDNPAADPLMGHIQSALDYRFSTLNPPEIRIVSVKPGSGNGALVSGNTPSTTKDTIVMTFSEGIRRDVEQLGVNIVVEDVTGAAAAIPGTLAWNAAEGDNNADLSGKDNVATFTPTDNWQFGTKVRVTFVGGTPPPLDKLRSDRATVRGGQLLSTQVYTLDVEKIPPLTVLSFVAGNVTGTAGAGAQGVAFDQSTITAVFSEALDCASVTAANAPVAWDTTDPASPGTAIGGAWGCVGDTATFTATAAFGYSRDVLTTLTTAVRSARAVYDNPAADPLMGHVQSSLNYRFSTLNPPEIRIVSVKTGSGNGTLVSGNTPSTTKDTIVMMFSEGVRRDVEQLGLNIIVEDVTGAAAAIPGTLSWNVAEGDNNADLSGKDNVATFTPDSNWEFGTKVRVTFVGGTPPPLDKLRSDRATVRGGQLLSTQVYTLDVEGLPDLYVKSVSPGMYTTTAGAGQPGVSQAAQTITVVFSEDVDCASVSAVTASVDYDTTDPVNPGAAVAGNRVCAGDTVTFTASAPFGYSRDVVGTLSTAVQSARATLANASLSPAIGHLSAAYDARFTTEDPEAPVVVSMTPGPVSTGVPRATTIAVTFDRAMDTTSFTDATFKACDTTNDVNCAINLCPPAQLAFSNGNATVTCTPASTLQYSAVIRVSLYGGSTGLDSAVATARGGWFAPQPDPFTYSFSIENLPQLQVLATNFSGSGTYSINQQLEFIFSDWLNWTAVQGPPPRIFLVKVADPATLIGATLGEPIACTTGNACKVTLTPSAPLDYATPYLAVVLGGYPSGVCRPERTATATDGCIPALPIGGTSYSGLGFNFTTESTPGLEVSATAPADGDTGIQLLPTLSVTFNNELNPATVATTSVCLTQGNNQSTDCSGALAVPINAWALSPDNRTVTSTPAAPLNYNTWYTIVVTKSVFDEYGQSLTAFHTAAFQTMTSALIQDIVVFNGNDLVAPNNLYVRVRFNEDMDLATITSSTMYLTYADGFGVTVPVPSVVTTPTIRTAVLTPDLPALYACDDMKAVASGNDGSTDAARPQSLKSAGTLFDASYIGKVAYVRSQLGSGGYYSITGIDIVNPGVDQRLILSGASFATETGVEWSVVEPFPVLPYSTTYTLHLVSTISNAAHTKHVEPLAGQSEFLSTFGTGTGPSLVSIVYENHVVKPANLYSATEVPINSKLTAAFNEALDPATVGNSTVLVEERRGSDGVIATPATFTSASAAFSASDVGKRIFVSGSISGNNGLYTVVAYVNPTTVTVNPNFALAESPVSWGLVIDGGAAGVISASADAKSAIYDTTKLPALLGYDTRYRLLLVGRYAGGPAIVLRLANGNPVLGLHAAAFRTSPSMTVTTNQKTGVAISQMMVMVAMFSRPLYTGSLTDSTFYATQQGVGTLTAMFATSTEFPNYVTYIPVPTWRQSGTGAVVTITTGVQDYRGNPMPSSTTITYPSVSNAPATTSIILDPPTSVSPSSGSIAADQEFTLTWVVAGNSRNVLHPASFGAASIQLVEDPAGAAVQVPTTSRVVPGGNTVGDIVYFRPARALKAGTAYRLTLVPGNMANLYHIASDDPNMVYNYTGETTLPVLGANQVTPNAAGQAPTTEVTAWFNEQMDLKTVSTSTFTVRVNGTAAAISGAYRQEYDSGAGQWKVIFAPSRPLKNTVPNVATSYDVVLTNGIKDLAGNAFAGQMFNNRFGVTGNAPLLVSHSPAAAAVNVPVNAQVAYNFNAAIDPVTAYAPTSTTPGSLGLTYTDGCGGTRTVYGCVRLQDGGKQVVYRPATPYRLPSSTVVTADFDAAKVADLAGNLAGKNGQAPWGFTIAAANPMATCHAVDAGAGTVTVRFTDDIDAASVSAATFEVFDVVTGVPLAGVLGVAGKDVTFTNAGAIPAGDYGILATTGIQSVAGSGLLTDYRAYFTVP